MKKEDASWLIIRLIGLALAMYAVYSLFLFLTNVFVVVFGSAPPVNGTWRLPNLNWEPAVNAVVFAGIAVYFLMGGDMVCKWLMREGASGGKP